MKRLIPATILLACIAVICIISNIAVSKSINTAKSEIEYGKECYTKSEFDKAKGSADTFNKLWIKKARIITAYSNHCQLDNITELAGTLPEAIRSRNDFEFYSAISRINTALDTIYKEQSLTLESLY